MARILLLWATAPLAAACLLATTGRWWFAGEVACNLSLHAAILLLPALIVWRRSVLVSTLLLGAFVIGLLPSWRAAWEERAPVPNPDQPAITVACANLYLYNDRAVRPQAVAAALAERPDLVVLAESISSVDRACVPLLEYPYQIWQPQLGRQWQDCVVLLSKLPITASTIHDVENQPFISATVDVNGRPLHVIAVHTMSPVSPTRLAERNAQFERLSEHVARVAKDGAPVLLLGDCNLTVASPVWRDWRDASGLRRASGPEPASWHDLLGPYGITVDHILGRGLALGPQTAFSIPGSDHRGLRGSIAWLPGNTP